MKNEIKDPAGQAMQHPEAGGLHTGGRPPELFILPTQGLPTIIFGLVRRREMLN